MNLSPITLFVYNRPLHTKKTIEALQKNFLAKESDLIIFSDGIKKEEHKKGVDEVRGYIKTIKGFKSTNIIESKENLGLAKSIINGVTKIVNEYGKIIVLEDDMITSKYFLEYMNNGLSIYEQEDQVVSIHGYVSPVKETLPETFFIKGADCWGWATWKRGWKIFEPDGKKLLNELKERKLIKEFDFSGTFPFSKMLRAQTVGKNNSWAIRWYASAFLKNKLTLYPRESLIYNIGLDKSGTHCGSEDIFNRTNKIENVKITVNKNEIKENELAHKAIERYYDSIKETLFKKVLRKFKELFIK